MADDALQLLRLRLAKGEITPIEYERTLILLGAPAPTATATGAHRPVESPVGSATSRRLPLVALGGWLLVAGAAAAMFCSIMPWYSMSALGESASTNPWFTTGGGRSISWFSSDAAIAATKGLDLIRFVAPTISVGLLLSGIAGLLAIRARVSNLGVTILGTMGVGLYACAAALFVVAATQNGLDMSLWSFGAWLSIASLVTLLSGTALLSARP